MRRATTIFGGTTLLVAAAAATWLPALQPVGLEPVAVALPCTASIVGPVAEIPQATLAFADDGVEPAHHPNIPAAATGSELALDPLLQGIARALGMPAPPQTNWKIGIGPLLRAIGLPDFSGSNEGASETALGAATQPDTPGVLTRTWNALRDSAASVLDLGVKQLAMVPVWSLTFLDGDKPLPTPRGDAAKEHVVVLVHGLDDPGWIWDQLAPALRDAGYCPVAFEYPNDGPLRTSADCLGEALARLRHDGVECVDLVSHSMGGLVVRDVLTRESWYDGDASGGAALPMVDRVIQVAPPNHGAAIARLQPISELKDQAVRLVRGTARRHGISLDGNGEAAADLQPGSSYLSELNRRPMPHGARFTIVEACLAKPPAECGPPGDGRDPVGMAMTFCRDSSRSVGTAISDWMGDGLVTSESSRLAGVDDVVVVTGNHQSVLRTWVPGRVAPGVPVVVERLRSR